MTRYIVLFLAGLLMNACFLMPLGAPHSHQAVCVENPDSDIKMWVNCQPHTKHFRVCGVEKDDTVYIRSNKIKNGPKEMTAYYSVCGDSLTSYPLRMGDSHFHRRAVHDTIAITIVKSDSSKEVYHFLVLKDRFIKG